MGRTLIRHPIDTYGHMTTEQARFEMDADQFEAWMEWNQRERDID